MKKCLHAWLVAVVLVTAALTGALHGAGVGIPAASKPEDVGLAADRLPRIHDTVQRYLDAGQLAGAVTLVARRGRVAHFEAHGVMDLDSKAPMRKDAIFRIASMSKPVTGVAIMMLVEEGKVRLTDPVSRFIPEFKELKVAVIKPGYVTPPVAQGQQPPVPDYYTVPANREITVRDLLTHTSGLESGSLGNRVGSRLAPRDVTKTLADQVPKLALVPLDFQPGSQWTYSLLAGMDTLSRIVEIASGQTYDRFLKQRLFDPLGMKDSGFFVADDKVGRIAGLYNRTPRGIEKGETPAWLATRTFFSGGGGLWSTAEDYAQFAQMLANGGELNGQRLLSPLTVELMASNHVGALYSGAGAGTRGEGMGFGLSMEVILDAVAANRRTSSGSFGWDGAFGTHFWVDPRQRLIGVLMVQTPGTGVTRDFENAVMQAIVD
ncbi:MAG TPA: serine hydrolase domain-containing protein [Vicinamibacterales bacterium]|nr:serine hydrolase domain-containing protein [Vicinamibacterales bacterium]